MIAIVEKEGSSSADRAKAILDASAHRCGQSKSRQCRSPAVPTRVTIEADLLAIDHVRDADDADERHRERDEDGD